VPARRYGTSIKSARRILVALTQPDWDMLELVGGSGPEGQAMLSALRGAARADELTSPLEAALAAARKELVVVMRRNQATAPPPAAPVAPPIEQPISAASVDLGTLSSHPPLPTESTSPGSDSTSAPHSTTASPQRAVRRAGGGRATASRLLAQLRAELDELATAEPDAVIEISWRVVE